MSCEARQYFNVNVTHKNQITNHRLAESLLRIFESLIIGTNIDQVGNKDILAVLTWLQNNSIIWNSILNAEIIKLLSESQRLSHDTNSYECRVWAMKYTI